jgi:hypothetical protein
MADNPKQTVVEKPPSERKNASTMVTGTARNGRRGTTTGTEIEMMLMTRTRGGRESIDGIRWMTRRMRRMRSHDGMSIIIRGIGTGTGTGTGSMPLKTRCRVVHALESALGR